MKKLILLTGILGLTLNLSGIRIPEQPKPARLVNDMANMLTPQEEQYLEQNLVQFSNSTSTQISVVTVTDLHGEDIAMVATEIGHQWGVGTEDKDNGIVLLIKQKTATEKGKAFIAVGYGLEGIIPDATAKRIIENELLPHFRQGSYYQGIAQALNIIIQLSLEEYPASEYMAKVQKKEKKSPIGAIVPILLFLFFFGNIFGRASRMRRNSLGRGLSFWVLLSLLGSGSRSSGGSFGNFSSGGGSFGGFGGGGFGGGGAGGSW